MTPFKSPIEHYMSSVLIVIGPSQPISEAIRLMRLHEIRHLPVVARNKVVGLISQRDIYLMQSLAHGSSSDIQVSEAMTSEPYTVEQDEPIDRVAREMVRRKIGTALVTHGNRLLGLFTATDALLALAALVEDDRVPVDDQIPKATPARTGKVARKRAPRAAPKRRKSVHGSKVAR